MPDHEPDQAKDKLADALRAMSGDESTADAHPIDESELIEMPPARPATPIQRRARPERPVRPPAPGTAPVEIVPAQAPKPSLRPEDASESLAPAADGSPRDPAKLDSPGPAGANEVSPPASGATDANAELSGPSGLEQIVDDDLVAVPAPSAEMLMAGARHRAAAPRTAKHRSNTLQRTLIPILLTLAFLLPGFGIWLLLRPEQSELRVYGQRLFIYLLGGGAVFLALAIVNMIQVRSAPITR